MKTNIKDCIYGMIQVSNLCKEFINTREFQRLRNIKQLGLVYFVFPSAVHTRFEHSLGVMHLSGVVIDNLKLHGTVISTREKELIQLAGLLHDVGHIAFSHLFDYMLEENNIHILHEERSVIILRSINSRLNLLTENEVAIVSNMIHGIIPSNEYPTKYFMYEIINNKAFGLDVDRLDYLQRDSYHTGISSFGSEYLISCMRVKDGRLAVLHRAKSEIEMLYYARRRLLINVCRHKSVFAIEDIIRLCINNIGYIKDWDNCDWTKLDDIEVLYKIRTEYPELYEIIETRKWERVEYKNILEHISNISNDSIDINISSINWV